MSARDDDHTKRPTTGAADLAAPAASDDTASHAEREKDLLVQLAGGRAFLGLDLEDPKQHPFLEWLARDLRERQSSVEQVEQGLRADALARRMVARVRARGSLNVRTIVGTPTVRRALIDGRVLQVARAAAAHRCAPLADLSVAAGVGRELWDEPCEEWIELPDDVADGSYVGLTVAGDSMQPLLHEGDVLLVQIGADAIEDTMIVARHPDDGYVVKRVGHVAEDEIELTSLNSAFAPVQIPRDASLIVGTVVMTWCNHRRAA